VTVNPLCQPCGSGAGRVLLLATALLAKRASQYLVIVSPSCTEQLRVWPHVPPPFSISGQHPRHRAVWMGAVSQPQFPVLGSATSGRLGRVTVPQLKVDRLCSIVDGTAEFDPSCLTAGLISPPDTLKEGSYDKWRECDTEETMRLYATAA